MNKRDQKNMLQAMRDVDEKSFYSCIALEYPSCGHDASSKDLCERYSKFFEISTYKNPPGVIEGWFGKKTKENQNTRLTALALFMVAEKDVV